MPSSANSGTFLAASGTDRKAPGSTVSSGSFLAAVGTDRKAPPGSAAASRAGSASVARSLSGQTSATRTPPNMGMSESGTPVKGESLSEESRSESSESVASSEGSKKETREDEREDQKVKEAPSAAELRRIRRKLGTVENLWLNSEELKFDSDADISDMSEIWSEYGEPISPVVQPKLNRWNSKRKNVSEKLSMKHRVVSEEEEKTRKRSKRRKNVPDEKDKKVIPGMSFIPIGKNQDDGVYFLDFSSHFKQCLKLAREQADREKSLGNTGNGSRTGSAMSNMEKDIKPGGDMGKSARKFGVSGSSATPGLPMHRSSSKANLIDSTRMTTPDVPSPKSQKGNESSVENIPTSPGLVEKGLQMITSPRSFASSPVVLATSINRQTSDSTATSAGLYPVHSAKSMVSAKEGGLGPRWPKGMWDNMDGHWRMIMAPGSFVVTPGSYNRQYEQEFRSTCEKVSFNELDKTRKKVRKWMAENSQHFAL